MIVVFSFLSLEQSKLFITGIKTANVSLSSLEDISEKLPRGHRKQSNKSGGERVVRRQEADRLCDEECRNVLSEIRG